MIVGWYRRSAHAVADLDRRPARYLPSACPTCWSFPSHATSSCSRRSIAGYARWPRRSATGKSITDAIRISRRTAPPLIADEISLLVTRLNNRWETRDALMRFADAVDSPDADAVIAALDLGIEPRRQWSVGHACNALADSIQAQLKGRRAIEVERSKPYVVVRQVTVISLSTLVLVFLLSPDFFAPYRTPLGQALLSLLLIMYVASLILMRRKAHQPDRPRILLGEHR